VLLFAGPTGVGKTELARALSQYLFGHGEQADRMVRLDMSEYAGPGAAERLVGDPAAGGPSDLVKRIRQQPFTVVLLDEIEKAAPEVFDVLLGVFDEGRLTDRFGRLSTFRSAVIVMTSNLGAGAGAGEPFGLVRPGSAAPGGAYESEVMRFFRPEFFNRIDAVVTFGALDEATVHAITEKELTDLGRREGLTRAGLTLAWDAAVVRHLAAAGFDRRYGARPLQRAIETRVVTPLARHLVANPGCATRPSGWCWT
jgi:ATP-dependent Clp protease ATP-binding subunit ClpC